LIHHSPYGSIVGIAKIPPRKYRRKADRRSAVWRDTHNLYLKRDLSPVLGNIPLPDITQAVLLGALTKAEARSGVKTADRVRQTAVQVFDYGVRKLKQIFVSGRVRAVFGVAALLDGNAQDSFQLLAGHNGSAGQPAISEVCLSNEGQGHTNLHGKAPPPRRGLRHGTLD
jgi:hypothetical protein